MIDRDEIVPEEFTTYFKSAIAFGQATIITEDELKREILWELIRKYSKEYESMGDKAIDDFWKQVAIVEIAIESISGKQAKELIDDSHMKK